MFHVRRNQQPNSAPVASNYIPGQVWHFKTPSDQSAVKLMILLVESYANFGTLVHILLTGVRLPNGKTTFYMVFNNTQLNE